jgi:hypothetical protein
MYLAAFSVVFSHSISFSKLGFSALHLLPPKYISFSPLSFSHAFASSPSSSLA